MLGYNSQVLIACYVCWNYTDTWFSYFNKSPFMTNKSSDKDLQWNSNSHMAKHASCLVQSVNFIYSDTKPAINHQRIRPSRTHVILNYNSYVLRILALYYVSMNRSLPLLYIFFGLVTSFLTKEVKGGMESVIEAQKLTERQTGEGNLWNLWKRVEITKKCWSTPSPNILSALAVVFNRDF